MENLNLRYEPGVGEYAEFITPSGIIRVKLDGAGVTVWSDKQVAAADSQDQPIARFDNLRIIVYDPLKS